MTYKHKLDHIITKNFVNTKLWHIIMPFFVISVFMLYLVNKDGTFTENYINIQKDFFLNLNSKLSSFAITQYNLTQIGDVIIVFPLLAVLTIYAPSFWKALITSSVISLFVSAILKKAFAIPRPAAAINPEDFTIIGKTLKSNTSLPSGHSITILIVFTTILYAFMPKRNISKFFWYICIISTGIIFAFSRVAVGAHYPIDVLSGSIIGYIIGVLGIVISTKYTFPTIKNNLVTYYILLVLNIIWAVILSVKIYKESLVIFYISFLSLLVTIFLIIKKIKCLQRN